MDFNPDVLQEYLAADLSTCSGELNTFRASVLKATILKKYIGQTTDTTLDSCARDDFVKRNAEISSLQISGQAWLTEIQLVLERVLLSGDCQTNVVTFGAAVDAGKLGPGSSVGSLQNDFYTKMFCGPISYTSETLKEIFLRSLSPRWAKAIAENPYGFMKVLGGKLSTVPKDSTKNRTISVEPVLNMYFQLGAKSILERLLKKHFFIDVTNQPEKNKALAQIGSTDASFATIDLRNASDCLSLSLANKVLPREVLDVLSHMRCDQVADRGKQVRLGMLSTMGNGFTFALMTMVLAALVKVTYLELDIPFEPGNFGVFGDDIIVRSEAASVVMARLELMGFVINTDKTFTVGYFRESCGGDFFHGKNVRGIYLKNMRTKADVYTIFNRLHRWSLEHEICLDRTLRYLMTLAPFRPVPRHESLDAGFIVSKSALLCYKTDRNGAILYGCCQSEPEVVEVGNDAINPHGALIAALGGYIRNNKYSREMFFPKYRVVKKKTPHWDYSPDPVLTGRGLEDSWLAMLIAS